MDTAVDCGFISAKVSSEAKSALVFIPGHVGRQSLGVAKTRSRNCNLCVSACVCVHVYV